MSLHMAMLTFVATATLGLTMIYVSFKSALVPQIIATENKIGIRQSFAMMKGQVLNWILIMMVVLIPMILAFVLGSMLIAQYLPMNLAQNVIIVKETSEHWTKCRSMIVLVLILTKE